MKKQKMTNRQRTEALQGFAFISPWMIGFVCFALGPVIFSLCLSFCKWDILTPIQFVGMKNYAKMVQDPLVGKSLVNTLYYAAFAIPLGMCGALGTALLLNQKLKAMRLFRTLFYVPSVTSGVATFLLWSFIFNPEMGLMNRALSHKVPWIELVNGIAIKYIPFIANPPKWLADPTWAMPALIIMSLWGVGGGMLIYLAGLQGIPEELYEAALLDGANPIQKFWYVTIPMLSPTIFFNLIMSIIGSFQVFGAAFVMTGGAPANSTLFYVLYLFQNAMMYFRMGYASAMAWLLFIIILSLTLIQLRLSKKWVHYQ